MSEVVLMPGSKIEYLEFTDGNIAVVVNKDRRRHIFIPPGRHHFPQFYFGYGPSNILVFQKKLKIPYYQWKNRWVK